MSKSSVSEKTVVVEETAVTPKVETKKKHKYSSNLSRNLQHIEKGAAKAGKRMADAASKGFDSWIEHRDKSASERKDGAIKDFTKNLSKALRKAMQEGSEAPADFLDEVAKMKLGFKK